MRDMNPTQPSFGSRLKNGQLPELSSSLLEFVSSQGSIPMERQVFVNRTLRMESIRLVGFDLDWTLADYQREPLEELTFQLSLDRLVHHH